MDIVIIPVYYRPEFLQLCLEFLNVCLESQDKEFWICLDAHEEDAGKISTSMKVEQGLVVNSWKNKLSIKFIQRKPHKFYGNSLNILEAYKSAYATDAEFVYLVEDDVIVRPDFFKWHMSIQKPKYFCSIAFGHKLRSPNSSLFYETQSYTSCGVCWRRENLGRIVEHANENYYGNLSEYLHSKFPASKYENETLEQDGLIRRIIERDNLTNIQPALPRCFHVGAYSYHRGLGPLTPQGTFSERLYFWRKAISNPDWAKKISSYQTDIETVF